MFFERERERARLSVMRNADGDATGVHIDGTTHTSNGWHVVFDRTLSDNWVRVTWAVILGSAPINLGQTNA